MRRDLWAACDGPQTVTIETGKVGHLMYLTASWPRPVSSPWGPLVTSQTWWPGTPGLQLALEVLGIDLPGEGTTIRRRGILPAALLAGVLGGPVVHVHRMGPGYPDIPVIDLDQEVSQ